MPVVTEIPTATWTPRNPAIRRIGVLGGFGSQSHIAFTKKINPVQYQLELLALTAAHDRDPCKSWNDLLDQILDQVTHSCLIPFHNTMKKYLEEVPGVLASKTGIHIVGVKTIEIQYCLLVLPSVMGFSEITGGDTRATSESSPSK